MENEDDLFKVAQTWPLDDCQTNCKSLEGRVWEASME